MAFLRNLSATILGIFIACGIMFLGMLLFISLAASGDDDLIIVESNSVLELNLSKPLTDYGGKYTFVDFDYNYEDYTGLYHILKAIKYAKTDANIKGISIRNPHGIQGGVSGIKAIRDALEDFKASGKFVYSYADMYSQREYYLGSVSDSVFVNPVGDLDFKGLSSEIMFFKDFQDQTGIKMEVIRHGEYKSAVEPFLQNSMSDPNREQITELLQSVWKTITGDISKSRSISPEKLNQVADSLGGRSPELALKNGLIDGIRYLDQYEGLLRKATGLKKDDEIRKVSIYDYAEHIANKVMLKTPKNKIAVIFAQGEISYGKGNNEIIGQEIMLQALREARSDEDVKGIILRVDSPGGDALASDIIWREVQITQLTKPVYVSMGNLAASGGYYISCGAEKIVAEPTTITGSIGVFGILPNVSGLAGKWGIHTEQVNTNAQSAGYSLFSGLTDAKRKELTESVERFYTTFVTKVAEGRNMTFEEVDAVARGRVWSGNEALEKGLVDEIGGLDYTIKSLAKDKGISGYTVESYPRYENSIEEILSKFGLTRTQITEQALEEHLGKETYQLLKQTEYLKNLQGIQARLPYELNIK